MYRNYKEGHIKFPIVEIQLNSKLPIPPLRYAPKKECVVNKTKFYNNEELAMWLLYFTLLRRLEYSEAHKIYEMWSSTIGHLHKIYFNHDHTYLELKTSLKVISKKVVDVFREINIVQTIEETLATDNDNTVALNNKLVYLTNMIRPVYMYLHLIRLKYYSKYGMDRFYLFSGYYLSNIVFSLLPEVKTELDHLTKDIFPSYLIGTNPLDQGKKYHLKLRDMLFGVYYPNLDLDTDGDTVLKDIFDYIDFIPEWMNQMAI